MRYLAVSVLQILRTFVSVGVPVGGRGGGVVGVGQGKKPG